MALSNSLTRLPRALQRRWKRRQVNGHIAELAEQVARHAAAPHTEPVVVFNASTRLEGMSLNAAFSLLTAWSLRLGGTPVTHFVCQSGMSRCVLGTDRTRPGLEPPCRACSRQSGSLYRAADVHPFPFMSDPQVEGRLQALDLDGLAAFEHEDVPLGPLVLPSLRWVLRRHHLDDDEATRFLLRQYILSAWNVRRNFEQVLDQVRPQAVVLFNGLFFPEATARQAAEKRGIRVVNHEVGLRPYSAFFTEGDATAYPIHIPEDFELSAAQNARLDAYLEQRFQGNFSMAGIRFWPEMKSLGADFWQTAGQFRQVVPVFTNVIFDTSQTFANVIFSDMFAWLDEVLALARRHPDTYFVIRAHPDEARPGKASQESVAGWARSRQVASLPNVLFVDANEYFSSYELIARSKFVMVYNSTIGLEASLMKVPVLCAGKARFTQLPTVFFPAGVEDFRRQAEDWLGANEIHTPAEFYRNARRFLYYQLFRSSLPFGDLIEEDDIWRGFVKVKEIAWEDVKAENSPTLQTIVNGILHGTSFELEV
ncbi:MAG: hypothetical protein VB089_09460 [Anaerolineaceae bacterium]|nr:hypothetical protein [Anaerolineaceae bacterium]